MVRRTPRVLSADEFDTLELAAMEFGGIGAGRWFNFDERSGEYDPSCPVCVNGLGIVAGMCVEEPEILTGNEIRCPTKVDPPLNDVTVDRLIQQGRYTVGSDGVQRVTWADYCKALNIVRGS